ncbi:hypothetical protein LJK88_08830 [Paenibacillus sp. P26]|nr:hypothetical protein LJK88_08830 [Paenibacillus sp. P26]UUZ89996.1 hypothetical protein LJK87_28730 [Paenibacillus sp. P25]
MNDYAGIMVVLLLGLGWLFVKKSKRSADSRSLRLIDYGLMLMAGVLVVFMGLMDNAEALHQYGH